MSWQKYRKVYFFFVPIEKEVTKIDKVIVIVSINKWENFNVTSLPKKQLYKFRIIS